MASQRNHRNPISQTPRVSAAIAILAVGSGAAGRAIQLWAGGWANAGQASDAALRWAALVSLPIPPLLLALMTTPRGRETRSWLGLPASAELHRGVLGGFGVFAALAGCSAMVAASPQADLAAAGWLAFAAQCSVFAATVSVITAALKRMALGAPVPEALTGGGAFGPAAAAPLLYAPALGWLLGMLPVAVAAAAWGGRGLPHAMPSLAWVVPILAATAWLAKLTLRAATPWAYAGLRAVAEAHAVRFAESRLLPAVPTWLALWAGNNPAVRWQLLAIWRQRPAGVVGSLAAAALAGMAAPAAAWAAGIVGAAVALPAGFFAAQLAEHQAEACAFWLGARPSALGGGRSRAAFALAVGPAAVAAVAALLGGGAAWAVAAGGAAGALAGAGWAARRPVRWRARAGATAAAALLAVWWVAA